MIARYPQSYIKKIKLRIYALICLLDILFLTAALAAYTKNNWESIFLLLIIVLTILFHLLMIMLANLSHYHFLQQHYLKITDSRLFVFWPDSQYEILITEIKDINIKKTNNVIKYIRIVTANGRETELSGYENMSALCDELTNSVNKNKIKYTP